MRGLPNLREFCSIMECVSRLWQAKASKKMPLFGQSVVLPNLRLGIVTGYRLTERRFSCLGSFGFGPKSMSEMLMNAGYGKLQIIVVMAAFGLRASGIERIGFHGFWHMEKFQRGFLSVIIATIHHVSIQVIYSSVLTKIMRLTKQIKVAHKALRANSTSCPSSTLGLYWKYVPHMPQEQYPNANWPVSIKFPNDISGELFTERTGNIFRNRNSQNKSELDEQDSDTSEGGGRAARPAAIRFKSQIRENRTLEQARTGHYSATQMKPWRGSTKWGLDEARKRSKGSAG